MRAISLLYHDVVPDGRFDTSGFLGGDADIYKLHIEEFQQHLIAIRSSTQQQPTTAAQIAETRSMPLMLTFDDGGSSAHDCIADLLEAQGWRGHFFVTTDWIGRKGFLNQAQIRDLSSRGHLIGSHSCSHPQRMSHCSVRALQQEWNRSVAVLSDILGARVTLASVPGGFYARNVAETAAAAGLTTLFTSEPRTRREVVNGCTVWGRYTIQQGVKPATAAAIANGAILPRFQQTAYWNAKKLAKTAGGTSWLRMRKWLLEIRGQTTKSPKFSKARNRI
jgi:peptidoglycan/xylan/chitin deacetylase (PgdA/CDA1 family)